MPDKQMPNCQTPDYTNPFIRLQTYYTWLVNNSQTVQMDDFFSFGLPIIRLHEITGIPLEVLRQDMFCLYQWQGTLDFDENNADYVAVNSEYNLEQLLEADSDPNSSTILEQLFSDGTMDNIPLHLLMPECEPESYQIVLTSEEAEALNIFQADNSRGGTSKKYESRFRIKDSYRFNHQYKNLNEKLDIINQAIQQESFLHIEYRADVNSLCSILLKPLKIAYDSIENLYSLISIFKGKISVHHLDQITSCKIENSKKNITTEPIDTSFLDIAPNVWGYCFTDPPEHVKVRFYNEANVWEKVRQELAYRTNGKLYEEDGFLYYEDTVYGIRNFQSWIYRYGSSAIVLEPLSLRQNIINSLKERQKSL